MRSSATSRCSSGILATGRIFDACTIAASSPAFAHSARNTEFSTVRATGFSPNEMFERPKIVWTSGCRVFNSRMASIVAMPSRRLSSCPVPRVNVRQSTRMSLSCMPHCRVRVSISRSATATLVSGVRAWPVSSIVSATTAAPCSRTIGMMRANRLAGPSPSSKLTELMTQRPPRHSSPASITCGSVESSMIGNVDAVANRARPRACRATPSRPT